MIVLVGFMGAGKTTIGNLLSARLGLPFADSDQVIEQRTGRPVRQIFAEDGEPGFRALEHQVIAELLDGPGLILALGGGAPEHPRTRALLAGGTLCSLGTPQAPVAPEPPAHGGAPRPPVPPWPRREGIGSDPVTQVVYLQVGYDQALRRVGGDAGRPMLARPDLAALYERRRPVYAGIATFAVSTDGRHPEAVSEDIVTRLARTLTADGRAP